MQLISQSRFNWLLVWAIIFFIIYYYNRRNTTWERKRNIGAITLLIFTILLIPLIDQPFDCDIAEINQETVSKDVVTVTTLATAPVIGIILWTPSEPLSDEPISVRVNITDEHPVTLVLLRYNDGYIWRNLTMSYMSPGPQYGGTLPVIGWACTIQIEVFACDSNGDWGVSDVMDIEIKQAVITTTSPIDPPDITLMSLGGIGSLVIIVALIIVRKRKKLDESLKVDEIEEQLVSDQMSVHALRGAEFVGNRLRFKVKVVNNTPNVITDLTITLSSYPRDSLNLEGDISRIVPKIDPQGFRSPSFEFLPTQDCVRGTIVASIFYADHYGEVHSMTTEPYIIRAVCDLLTPESISPEDFNLRLNDLEHGEITLGVEEWTPEEMQAKTLKVLETSNFFEVSCETEKIQEHIESRVTGWAKGKYTGKNIGVEVVITGLPGVRGATCKVHMSGEDDAMIMPAIDEIGKKLSAWLCPLCGGGLPIESVREVKAGKTSVCSFCGITIGR